MAVIGDGGAAGSAGAVEMQGATVSDGGAARAGVVTEMMVAFEMLVMPLVSALMRFNPPLLPTATAPRIAPVAPPSPSCKVPPLMAVPPV